MAKVRVLMMVSISARNDEILGIYIYKPITSDFFFRPCSTDVDESKMSHRINSQRTLV